MLVGLLAIVAVSAYVWSRAGRHRWTFLAGLMIGLPVSAVPTLGRAITNTDPAVRYAPSTVPVLIATVVLGAIGACLLVASTARHLSQRSGRPH